jgi:hypothetical protein
MVGEQVPRYVATQLGLTAERLAQSGAVTAVMGSTDAMRCSSPAASGWASPTMVSDELMEAFAAVERLTASNRHAWPADA